MTATPTPARGYPALLARLDGLRTLGVDFGLERVRRALAALGSPERRLPAVQIAGTNGKGSTAAMTEAILRAGGWRTGLYTSPHLSRFTERIRVAGVEVDGDRLAQLDHAVAATGVPLTYFEVATVLAFLIMADEGVELAVLETGLGGRLDAVTACEPLATAITSIGWDHMDYLGSTLAAIAREKAGILKPGVPCFIAQLPPEADAEIAQVAREVGAPLFRLGRDVAAAPALAGAHQRSNAALAVALASEVARRQRRALAADAIARGLGGVRWPARLETVTTAGGEVILDCAHNPEGAEALASALPPLLRGRRATLVISVVAGKDLAGVLQPLLPIFANVIATRSHNPRALAPAELAAAIRAHAPSDAPPEVTVVEDARNAIAEAQRRMAAGPDAAAGSVVVVVAGSIFLAAEVRAALLDDRADPQPVSDPL